MSGKSGVSLNWGGFDKALGNAAKRIGSTGKLMASIGEALVSGVKTRFKNEEDPEGRKWKASARALAEGGKTLTDTARLRDSIDYAATPTKVMVGSNLPYARIHQLGGTIRPKKAKRLIFKGPGGEKIVAKQVTIPARPYLGVSKADMEEVRATMEDFLKSAFKG